MPIKINLFQRQFAVINQIKHPWLAALNVPIFSGDYKKWSMFHDIFVALVHENSALTAVQKFFYLKSALVGNA